MMKKNRQPMLGALLTIEHRDKNRNLIERIHRKSHSWVENFYCLVFCQATGNSCEETTYGLEAYEDDGTKHSEADYTFKPYGSGDGLLYDLDGNVALYEAIAIGTDDSAELFADYALGAIIPHGTGTGEMVRSYCTRSFRLNGTTYYTTIDRTFTNNSGATIGVNECGWYGCCHPGNTDFLLNRDKLDSEMNIDNGETIYVAYTVYSEFPE